MISDPSRHVCRGCKRDLPRAASRCPWCHVPVPPFAGGPRRPARV